MSEISGPELEKFHSSDLVIDVTRSGLCRGSGDETQDPANTPPPSRPGHWIRALLELADGSEVELRIPASVAAAVSSYIQDAGEVPSISLTTLDGKVRRGRLGQLFGGALPGDR